MPTIRLPTLVIICLALVAVIAFMIMALLQANRLDDSAQELAIAATLDAFQAEYPRLLIENSHPNFQTIFPSAELLRYLENTKRILGPLSSLTTIRGSTDIAGISRGQSSSSAEFEINLEFQNTPAIVNITMETLDDRWLITAFRLSADLLRS